MADKKYTTAEVAIICGRSQRTILRWLQDEMFNTYIKVKDGYLFYGSTKIRCFKKVVNGTESPMTISELDSR